MPNYRRVHIPGGCYFFTVNLQQRKQNDLLTRYIKQLRVAVANVRRQHPFHIDAWVVLPEHMHCIWTLPENDKEFAVRWRLIKSAFSKSLPQQNQLKSLRDGERGIWQRRYWEHLVRDDKDFQAHLDYLHYNPVKHGHVDRVVDWPYSTFHRLVSLGVYPSDWGGGEQMDFRVGE